MSTHQKFPSLKAALAFLVSLFFAGTMFQACGTGEELVELAELELNPPERQAIDTSRMGVNNFFVHPEFGSISEQYQDIRQNIRLGSIRILLAWTNEVQPSRDSAPDFSFFDDIINNAPAGTDLLLVIVHAPDWMLDSGNWIDGDPIKTWVELWLKPVVQRYRGRAGVNAYEVWNEPDLPVLPGDQALELTNSDNYLRLIRLGSPAIRELDPGALIVMAATQSIQQDFPDTLNYNRRLRDGGIQDLVDIYNIHYYAKLFENVIRDDGVKDFLSSIRLPIWITESGETQPDRQLAYVEQTWPFLRSEIPGIDRIYYYEYANTGPRESNFGLRTTIPSEPVSDLYTFLRDR